jgi:hypothetical protein
LSKLVVRLPDETVLDWFRRGWDCDDPEAWVEADLGTDACVYGLDDEHSVRLRTDDEVELAYFFLGDAVLHAAPDRLGLPAARVLAAAGPGR